MTRAERLEIWRTGFTAGYAAGKRDHHDRQLADLAATVREFDAERRTERQARIDALLTEVIGVLADAMLADDSTNEDAA